MSDYIKKQDALDAVEESRRLNHHKDAKYACVHECEHRHFLKILMDIKPADVAPVVHSRWEYKCGEIRCPECGNKIHRIDLSGCLNFCPNCGAKMVE